MNILWLSHNVPYPPKTGVLQRNYNLVREASKLGNVHLVAVFQKAILPIRYDMEEIHRELGKFCKSIEIIYLPIDSSKVMWLWTVLKSIFTTDPYSVNWIKSRQMHHRIRQITSKIKFDIVHFDTISLAEYFDDVGIAHKILNHHNMESHLMERRSSIEKNILKKFYYQMEAKKLRRYEETHCKKFDINFTVSQDDKELLQELIPGCRIEVIPNGVDTDYFRREDIQPSPGTLVFAGGMNWYPNRDAILHFCREIWPLLKKGFPEISLTVVGAQPPRELLELAERDPKIVATGFVDDVRPYFANAEVYICPMRDGGGTRLKILDTLSMSTALVSTTIGCEGIKVTPETNVLIADTPVEFVTQVKRVFQDPELRKRLGREGRKLVEEKYSWEVIGNTLRAVYADLCQRTF